MTRVVVDANVLGSAAAGHPNSPSRQIFAALTSGRIDVVLCGRVLDELAHTLGRRYFSTRVTPEECLKFDATLRLACDVRPNPERPRRVLRDPDDDYLVALAIASSAEAIVTGDKDLLEHPGLQPPALTPREACARFLRD